MAKKGRKPKQMKLINTEPDNIEAIAVLAEDYAEAQAERIKWLGKEKDLKQKILDEVKKAGLKPLENGVIRFRADGKLITITPRDELIKVNYVGED